jgi:hypothetical protein
VSCFILCFEIVACPFAVICFVVVRWLLLCLEVGCVCGLALCTRMGTAISPCLVLRSPYLPHSCRCSFAVVVLFVRSLFLPAVVAVLVLQALFLLSSSLMSSQVGGFNQLGCLYRLCMINCDRLLGCILHLIAVVLAEFCWCLSRTAPVVLSVGHGAAAWVCVGL